jgi:hypothetical protein
MTTVSHLLVWTIIAFWLWVVLAVAFVNFRVPAPVLVAAILSWIAAGLLITWAGPFAG